MAGDGLFVSCDGLEAGSRRCDDASAAASSGAELLRRVSVDEGIFGDFDAGHDFHGVASDVHEHQVGTFAAHCESLATLSSKGRRAAQVFTGTDHESAAILDQRVRLDGS